MKNRVLNPYLGEGVYIPDGEPHVFDGRLYIYGSHDRFGSMRYCPGDYEVWSAPVTDLSDWSCPGPAYRRVGKRNRLGFRCMWAPDCTRGADGRFYLYYCFDFDNRICVASSDYPDRDFSFLGYVHHPDGTLYGQGPKDIMCFDPAVFTDDDGEIYLYSGYSANEDLKKMLNGRGITNVDGTGGQVVRLCKDHVTVKGEPKMLIPGYKNNAGTGFEGHEMYEASSVRKFNGRYYFFYSSRLSHELAYAVSDKPYGCFKYCGPVVSNGDIGYGGRTEEQARNYWGNVHGAVEYVNGEYYVFYHRQTNKNEQTRQGCAERVRMTDDGLFSMTEMTTQGLSGGPLPDSGEYPAYAACSLMSAEGAVKCAYGPFSRGKYRKHPCITEYEKGKQCIRDLLEGATAGFRYFSFTGPKTVRVTVRGDAGQFEVRNGQDSAPVGVIPFEASPDWNTFSAEIPFSAGVGELYFTRKGSGKTDFLKFTLI